jgi:hypothetical protein
MVRQTAPSAIRTLLNEALLGSHNMPRIDSSALGIRGSLSVSATTASLGKANKATAINARLAGR